MALLALPLVFYFWALAVQVHWMWWLVPLGMPALSLMHSYGMLLMAGILISGMHISNKQEKHDLPTIVVATLFAPWFSMGMGWIVHSFMLMGY